MKKHDRDEDVEMDTVENQIDGLAEKIIKEDEERRAQELVSFSNIWYHLLLMEQRRTCTTSHLSGQIGTSSETWRRS